MCKSLSTGNNSAIVGLLGMMQNREWKDKGGQVGRATMRKDCAC